LFVFTEALLFAKYSAFSSWTSTERSSIKGIYSLANWPDSQICI